jgi:hypothetical protein
MAHKKNGAPEDPLSSDRLTSSRGAQVVTELAGIHGKTERDLLAAADLLDAAEGTALYDRAILKLAKEIRYFGDNCHNYGRRLEALVGNK